MDRTVRIKSLVWFASGAMLAVAVTVTVLQAWRVDAAPGDTDTTFVPITPCRLVDTRQPGGAPLDNGEIRTIDAHGSNGPIAGSQCTIPSDAVGLSMNVTALNASAVTFWTIWPDGEPQPEASSLNPAPGQPPTPNAVTSPISTAGRFKVFNLAGSVDMLIDVNGYYVKTSLTELASRLTAAESNIATNATAIMSLDSREPFAVRAVDDGVIAQSTPTEIVNVMVTAPAAGHVIATASGFMTESSDGESVQCGLSDSGVTMPADAFQWTSPTGGDVAPFSTTSVFVIDAGATVTYSLVCRNLNASSSGINFPKLSAIFTSAP